MLSSYMHECTHIHTCIVHMHVLYMACMYVCMYACIYVYMYIDMYVHAYKQYEQFG